MSTIRVVNLQHTDATEPNIVLLEDGTSVFASGITISGGTNLTVSGTAEFASGTVSAPGVTFIDDNNTGLYSPAADTVAITTAATERLRVDSSGNVGIGTTSPSRKLHVNSSATDTVALFESSDADCQINFQDSTSSANGVSLGCRGDDFYIRSGLSTERMRIDSSGRLLLGTSTSVGDDNNLQIVGSTADASSATFWRSSTDTGNPSINFVKTRGSVASPSIVSSGDILGHIRFNGHDGTDHNTRAAEIRAEVDGTPGANDMPGRLMFSTTADGASSPTERLRIDSSGNVGIGTSSPNELLQLHQSDSTGSAIQFTNSTTGTGAADGFSVGIGDTEQAQLWQAENNYMRFATNNTERMRIDSSGIVLINTTSAGSKSSGAALNLVTGSSGWGLTLRNRSNNDYAFMAFNSHDNSEELASIALQRTGTNLGDLFFSTNGGNTGATERMRIGSNGYVYYGNQTNANPAAGGQAGLTIRPDPLFSIAATSNSCMNVGRNTNDGTLINFYQAGSAEGSISVSGSTVSYNGAHLSRWSQLPSGAERTEILRGSVLSNLDEMCEWGEEDNEQLNRMQLSNVEGDKNVSGVFQAWDDDDDTYVNDFYCAMTGDFVIRIAQGTTVARGDLLMSAGDGTAKPQDDDIIRSKTIAKVTSTNVSETYEDGSYCVPCVLMAC